MNLVEIQNKALETYIRNMEFLEKHSPMLHNKLKIYDEGLNLGLIPEKFQLEFKDNKYFDIYDIENSSWFYGEDSLEYSKNIVSKIDTDFSKNTFKTFYEQTYNDNIFEMSKVAPITYNSYLGNAAIIHYVQHNTPQNKLMKVVYKYFVFGVGLGIHLSLLHEKIKAKKYLFIEPSLEIFRLSLFVTDYELISKNTDVHFSVSENINDFSQMISYLNKETFLYDQYIKFLIFSNNCDIYIEVIQKFLVAQNHFLYSYDRCLISLQRTCKYISEGFKYLKLTNNNLFEKPVILLAAGPSLSKDIEFVKKNKDKFIIVSIYVILPYLEEHDIIPDIITQYDQADKPVMKTVERLKNKQLFNNCIFIFASHLVEELVNFFPKENIYLFQALYNVKKDYKTLSSPSIGEISYALLFHLGIKELYILGIDMALSDDGRSHIDNHGTNYGINRDSSKESISFTATKIIVKGNFKEEVTTLPIYNISINSMNKISDWIKILNIKVYNLSDGAYFNNTLPLKANEIRIEEFVDIDKVELHTNLVNNLNMISSLKLTSEEKKYNKRKLRDSKKLYKVLRKFHNNEYLDAIKFKKSIFKLFDNLIYVKCECLDLQDILLNFYKNNLPYIFHFFNMKYLEDEKNHIEIINKLLFIQTEKIFKEYFLSLEQLEIKI